MSDGETISKDCMLSNIAGANLIYLAQQCEGNPGDTFPPS
jgi:hypothetical protein